MKQIIEALKTMGVFFETSIVSIKFVDQIVTIDENDVVVAISFGLKKNNPVLLIRGKKYLLYAKEKFFDLDEKKLINKLQFVERFFDVTVEDNTEELVLKLEDGEISFDFDLHNNKICGERR